MKRLSISILLAAAAVASPALAQGPIGTVTRGVYVCELPGDAAGRAGIVDPDASFTIQSASRYSAVQGRGTYLRRGDVVTLTSGPRQGEKYLVVSPNNLRRLVDGRPARLRCLRQGG